jgi:peptide/nickel transport system substrate-binding protein
MDRTRLTRRTFIVYSGVAMASLGLLAACGDEDDTDDAAPAAPDTDDADDEPIADTDDADAESDDSVDADDTDDTAEDTSEDRVLRVATSGDIIDLHFANLGIAGDRLMAQNIYNHLIRFAPGTLEPDPDLCEDWEVSDDGLVWTFNLRDGLEFHHGYGQVTSEDVRATIEYHLDPDNGSREAAQYRLVEEIETPDELTVVLTLGGPSAAFTAVLAWQSGFITSAAAIEDRGSALSFDPVGAGPYYLAEWNEGEGMTLRAHEGYHGPRPAYTTIELPIIPDDTLALLALSQGEIDTLPVWGIGAYRELQTADDIDLYEIEGVWQYWAQLQTQNPPTDDVLVRRALAHAADLDTIAAAVNGMVTPNPSFLPRPVVGWTDDITTYEFDLDRARELLAEAGYDDPADVNIHLRYTPARLYEEMGLILQDMWTELGVTVEITVDDQAVWSQRMNEGEWNCYPTGVARLESDVYATDFFHSEGPSNRPRYNNPEADQLMDEARVEQDPDRRAEMYRELQEIIAQDVPVICTGTWQTIIAASPEVTNIIPHPYTGIFWFQEAEPA